MDFFDVIENRHSIRAYKDREVEEEKLLKILEVVRKAPSAGNLQAYML
ncbi:MAG: nitroreductase, partial [Candidatus Nitrosothermus koennekii]